MNKKMRLVVLNVLVALSFLIGACTKSGDIISGDAALRRDTKNITDVTCSIGGGYKDPATGLCVSNH